jgi:hypothetical protein
VIEQAKVAGGHPVSGSLLGLAAALLLGLAAALLLGLAGGCGDDLTGVPVPNRPPRVTITAGPSADSLHIHRVTFFWSAQDDDGRITGYQYAVDDTATADSLHTTDETEVSLIFTADDFHDTVIEVHDGRPVALQRFGSHHTFHVRARDDEGAWSPFAYAALFAVSVAPTTAILIPNPGGIASVGFRFEITWQGEDLDGRFPPRLFSTRLIEVPADSLLSVPIERLDALDAGPAWSPFQEGIHATYDVSEGAYFFGVRAMDEAGAVEPLLREHQNAIRLRVTSEPGLPVVVLSGPGKTVTLPSANEPEKTFDLVSRRPAIFTWSVDASAYGGRVTDIAYGIDLESVDPNDPGWVPTANPAVTVEFDNPPGVEETEHLLLLRIRDSVGQVLVVDAILRVGPPDFTREILIVDDWGGDSVGSNSNPQDAEHDRFLREVVLAEAARRGFVVDEVEYTDTRGRPVSGTPDLTQMRRYRLLVWNAKEWNSALHRSADPERSNPIADYLELGGNLWLFGEEVFTRSIWLSQGEFFGFSPGDFGYEYVHIETRWSGSELEAGGFLRPRGNMSDQRIDGLDACRPTAEAAVEGWPALEVAKEPFTSPLRGIPRCEGMVVGYEQGLGQPGDLDTLYTFISNGSRLRPVPFPSRLDDAPCAFRFSGVEEHGKVMVFTFPLYWWSDGAADSLGQRAIAWFWDEVDLGGSR